MSLTFRYRVGKIPEGEPITAQELEAMYLKQLDADGSAVAALEGLAALYAGEGRITESIDYLNRWMAVEDDLGQLALIYLKHGALREQLGDYPGAVTFYRAALAHEPESRYVWYFIHNNLGFSLIQIGEPEEALPVLQHATEIDPTRANAFKNVGLAHQALGRLPDAARYFVKATQANATDGRSCAHLEQLLTEHPGLAEEHPDIGELANECRAAVDHAQAQQPDLEELWTSRRARSDLSEDETVVE
jgi:tetratricopeptide (TPR) repeat protein